MHESKSTLNDAAPCEQGVTTSIVLPARNEATSLAPLLKALRDRFMDFEIIVVDDGSTDETKSICEANDVTCISHPYSKGNGAAVKTGARAASGDVIVFMDADGQHDPDDVSRLLQKLAQGFDMVVGARNSGSQASVGRLFANSFYNWFASWVVGHRVDDLTSGFRAVRAVRFREFLHLLPNGFSYPTTSTLAFFRSAHSVAYVPIRAGKRIGKSHIRPIRDGVRFMIIIFRICTLFSPMRLFGPISAAFFTTASIYYIFTYLTEERFTNMSALLYSTSIIVFLIGLISEQITMLIYKKD